LPDIEIALERHLRGAHDANRLRQRRDHRLGIGGAETDDEAVLFAHLRDHVRPQARPDPWDVVVGRIEMGVDRCIEQQRGPAAAAANASDGVA
jgi:hypothetical protein